MRIYSRSTLRNFWAQSRYHDAAEPLRAWYTECEKAHWKNTAQVKKSFGTVDFVKGKAVFNIGGNKYRLIVDINFEIELVFVLFVGTHKDYDKVDFEAL